MTDEGEMTPEFRLQQAEGRITVLEGLVEDLILREGFVAVVLYPKLGEWMKERQHQREIEERKCQTGKTQNLA